jgi:hypothetical protein
MPRRAAYAGRSKVARSAGPVEKVRMAISVDFNILLNQ